MITIKSTIFGIACLGVINVSCAVQNGTSSDSDILIGHYEHKTVVSMVSAKSPVKIVDTLDVQNNTNGQIVIDLLRFGNNMSECSVQGPVKSIGSNKWLLDDKLGCKLELSLKGNTVSVVEDENFGCSQTCGAGAGIGKIDFREVKRRK